MHNAKAILTTRRAGGLFVLQSSVFRINEKLLNGEQGPALTKTGGKSENPDLPPAVIRITKELMLQQPN